MFNFLTYKLVHPVKVEQYGAQLLCFPRNVMKSCLFLEIQCQAYHKTNFITMQ